MRYINMEGFGRIDRPLRRDKDKRKKSAPKECGCPCEPGTMHAGGCPCRLGCVCHDEDTPKRFKDLDREYPF